MTNMPRITYTGITCKEANCSEPARTKYLCLPHYMSIVRNSYVQCKIDGCQSRYLSKRVGLCTRHTKDANAPVREGKAVLQTWSMDRLRACTRESDTGCWLWGGPTQNGYGRADAKVDGMRINQAHRLSYYLANGALPDNMHVHHKCATRSCVNPEHLQLVTAESNIAEMHGRNKYLKQIGEQAIEISELREKIANLQSQLSEYTMWEGSEAELQEALLQDTHVITIHNK